MAIPSQANKLIRSPKNTIAMRAVVTGIRLPNNKVKREPSLIRVRKYRVSPRQIPAIPLAPSSNNVLLSPVSMPVGNNNTLMQTKAMMPLPTFILKADK